MEEIIQLTEDLIRFQTMHSRPDEILRCAGFIETYLETHDVGYKRMDHDQIPSILVTSSDGFVPLLLMSHFDVVDGPDELFKPALREGKLFGRGSLDDKYAVALSLVLVKEHLDELRKEGKGQDDLQCGILMTGDEEVGGKRGAKETLKGVKADFCIALDGGGLGKIVVKEKGVLRLKLISRGKAAHGARPWIGENAIEKLIEDYNRVKTFFKESAPGHWHRTMNFSIIHAGKSVNQVPDYAEAFFDIRFTENDAMDDIIEKMREAVLGELVVEGKEPLFQGGDSPYLDLLLDISKDTKVGFEHGASDARFLSEHGIKGIVWGADGDQSAHAEDEHVDVESVNALYRILEKLVKRSRGI